MPRNPMRSEQDELDRVSTMIHDEATRSRDIPDYADVTLEIKVKVSGMKVAEILQAEVSKDRLPSIDDPSIVAIVQRYYDEIGAKPVVVDLSPYHARVRTMTRGGGALPPVVHTWPSQTTGEQQ